MKQEDLFDSLSDHFEAKAEFGETEELTEANFVIPEESDYVDFGEDTEEVDVASLWENIRKKKEREGKNYRPAKPGDKDRPSQEALKRAQGEKLSEPDSVCKDPEPKKKDTSFVGKHQVTAPPTMTWQGATAKEHADDVFNNPGEAMKRAKELGLDEIHTHKDKKGNTIFMPGKTHEDYMDALRSKADTTEALQYGKPKKNDPRKTPAKPSERKKGSKKNKPDSAKDDKGKITFSKSTMEKLSKAMREHNKKGKGSKATMGQLKAVYRRGAGAFSTSHAPNMSRDGWGMARVRAFLYLLRNGRPSNPNYKQDNDLLPKGHPRSSKASMTEKQREALDKDKDGKITKKDFEMLRESKGAEYKGRKVSLNKPFRTPSGPKKFAVYTKNESGNVVIVRFGDPNMKIKKNIPERRKSFRARHNCDNPGPKWKARYWSCKAW
jgi:hypothetical protein